MDRRKEKKQRKRIAPTMTDAEELEKRNWAGLMTDTLHIIYTLLPHDLQEYVRFRSVCTGWRNLDSLADSPPKFPWLLKCGDPWFIVSPQPTLRFYSLAGRETSQVRNTERYRGMVYYGPGHGYLLVCSEELPYLLNPLTGNKILLPELDAGLWIHSLVCSGSSPLDNWYIVARRWDSESDDDFGQWTCVIYHKDTNSWKYVDIGEDICDASCHTCRSDNLIFATEDKSTGVYDAVSGERLNEVPVPEGDNFITKSNHLIESAGKIFRVCRYSDGDVNVKDSIFGIYELRSEEGEGEGDGEVRYFWVSVPDIGNQILFLDAMNGFSVNAPPGLDGNCIYFMKDYGEEPRRYDIGTGTVEEVSCPFKRSTWFIPSLG